MSSKTYGLTFLKFYKEKDTSDGYFKKTLTAPEDQISRQHLKFFARMFGAVLILTFKFFYKFSCGSVSPRQVQSHS